MTWIEDTAVHPLGDGRYAATMPEHWTALQGMHGGYVAAVLTRAVDASVGALAGSGDPARTLRAATFGFLRGTVVGELEIRVEIVRAGSALVATHVEARQDGKVTVVGRLHHSPPFEGEPFSDAPARLDRPADAVRIDDLPRPVHISRTESWLHPRTQMFGGSGRAEWIGWNRPRPEDRIDIPWLVMLGDFYPPPVFAARTAPARAVSIEYAVQMHTSTLPTLATNEDLATRFHSFHAAEGFAVEDGTVHAPDGTLLMTARQTHLSG